MPSIALANLASRPHLKEAAALTPMLSVLEDHSRTMIQSSASLVLIAISASTDFMLEGLMNLYANIAQSAPFQTSLEQLSVPVVQQERQMISLDLSRHRRA